MQIKQLTNGKIQFWLAGKIVFSCLPSQNYRVRNSNEIQLVSTGQPAYSIFADQITQTSIFGGTLADVSFNNSQELSEYLDSNFFFEPLVISSVFSVFGETGDYNQTQASGKTFATSTALSNGTMYAVPIWLGGVYTDFAMIKIGAATGDFNFAIYSGDLTGGNPHIPLYFAPNLYFFGFQANSNLSFRGATTTLTFNGFTLTGTPDMSAITRYTSLVAYASTMPDTFPAITKDLSNPNIPLLFQKKQL
jgi:hypothetical protein